MNAIGIDVGGTHVRIGVVSDAGRVDDAITIPTRTLRNADAFLSAIGNAAYEKIKSHKNVRGIGLALPGIVNDESGESVMTSNLAILRGMDLRGQLETRLELPTVLETDANAAALAEYRFGAGRGAQRLLVVSVGTGVGVGVILEGSLVKHTRGTGGSLGHIIIDPTGPDCGCGGKGCVEALASGRALLARLGIPSGEATDLTWDEITRRLAKNDAEVTEAARFVGQSLGVGVASWLALYQPDRVVLRGGVASLGPTWLDAVKTGMLNIGSPYYTKSVSICLGELDQHAGILGAGWTWLAFQTDSVVAGGPSRGPAAP